MCLKVRSSKSKESEKSGENGFLLVSTIFNGERAQEVVPKGQLGPRYNFKSTINLLSHRMLRGHPAWTKLRQTGDWSKTPENLD